MPASTSPTTTRRSELETPKLRSSCDDCGISKVKCDRGHPECGRCVTLGLTCVYGLSRKSGKPPRKRPRPNLDATSEKYVCVSWTSENRNNSTTMDLGEAQGVDEHVQANFSEPVVDMLPFPCGINTALSNNEQSQQASTFYPSLSLDDWPQLDILETDLEIPSASLLEPTGTVRASSDSPHSCPRESYEIFRDLICPSPSLHAPESNSVTVSARFDEVLHFNKIAVDRLSQLLKCPCARSGHRAMVHASIVSRILIWYQQAAGWSGNNSLGIPVSTLANSSTPSRESSAPSPPLPLGTATGTGTTSASSLVQATGFTVEHVGVSVGNFSIEDQNLQTIFRNQLVLSELKKAAGLIDMFVSQESSESSVSSVTGLYSHLGEWLRSEHSRTVETLKTRLSALKENVEV